MRNFVKWQRHLVFALLFVTGIAFANVQSPVAVLDKVSKNMIGALEKNKRALKSQRIIFSIVNRTLIPHIDLNLMSAYVIGRPWRGTTSAQRQDFIKQFTRLVTSTYAAALSSYDGDVVRFYPLRVNYQKRKIVTVNSMIVRRNGRKIQVSYNMIRRGNTWKVYDFSIEGISMVNSYRSQFAGVLANQGMKGLLVRLRRHNQASR